jgi:cytochrome c oxidase subunit 2
MKIESYEKVFLTLGSILLGVCLLALLYASVGRNIHLPGHVGRLDPLQVPNTPPFNNPGIRQTADNAYEVVITGQMFLFTPNEIRVPAGADVTFTGTSMDVIHGLSVEGTRVNMMLIPGQISRNTYRFERPGEYLMICHEYCGAGHHTMYGKVIVE